MNNNCDCFILKKKTIRNWIKEYMTKPVFLQDVAFSYGHVPLLMVRNYVLL